MKIKNIFLIVIGLTFKVFLLGQNQSSIQLGSDYADLSVKGMGESLIKIENSDGNKLFLNADGNLGINLGSESPLRSIDLNANDEEIKISKLENISSNTDQYDRVVVMDNLGNVDYEPLSKYVLDLPLVSTLKYTSKTTKIPALDDSGINGDHQKLINQVKENSVTTLGNIRVRFRPDDSDSGNKDAIFPYYGYIEVQLVKPNYYACFWEKVGAGTESYDEGSTDRTRVSRYFQGVSKGQPDKISDDSAWLPFRVSYNNNMPDNYNPNNRDIVTAILILNNSRDIYRLNFVANGLISADKTNNVPAIDGMITIFIEQLTSEEDQKGNS